MLANSLVVNLMFLLPRMGPPGGVEAGWASPIRTHIGKAGCEGRAAAFCGPYHGFIRKNNKYWRVGCAEGKHHGCCTSEKHGPAPAS
jgi:hypothetical protein